MLGSNIGFTMNTHFCGGKVVETSFSIGFHNPDCGMEDMDCDFIPSTEKQLKQKPCCENQHHLVQGDETTNILLSDSNISSLFLITFFHSFIDPISVNDEAILNTPYFPPPLPEKDIQVLFQTFLI